MFTVFEQMPKQARVWIYQAERRLSAEESLFVAENSQNFVKGWTAHNQNLKASFEIRFDQFLILSVDETQAGASGCSIDKSVHFVQWLEEKLDINFLDRSKLAFLVNNEVKLKPLNSVKEAIAQGDLGADTLTFNNYVGTKADLENEWIVPAKDSWMKKYF